MITEINLLTEKHTKRSFLSSASFPFCFISVSPPSPVLSLLLTMRALGGSEHTHKTMTAWHSRNVSGPIGNRRVWEMNEWIKGRWIPYESIRTSYIYKIERKRDGKRWGEKKKWKGRRCWKVCVDLHSSAVGHRKTTITPGHFDSPSRSHTHALT